MVTNWTLDGDEVLALPLDELALRVLRNAEDNDEWNWRSWLLSAQRDNYPRQIEAYQALGEAWECIQQHGLITSHPTQSTRDAFVLSRKGRETLKRGLEWVRAVARLDVALVPALEFKARPQYLRGDFATAAFVAMKEVEVQVRAKAQLGSDDIGVKLMNKAFRPGGPLHRADREGGESTALMNMFQGAIGLFKNPSSHREVGLNDPTEAAEIVLLADLLLRLLDKIENPTETTTPAGDSPAS